MTKEPWRMVKNRSWDRYKKIITDFLDWDAGRQSITWAKHVNQLLSHAEDSIPKYITSKSRHYVTTMLSETGLSIRQLFQENWMMKTYQY